MTVTVPIWLAIIFPLSCIAAAFLAGSVRAASKGGNVSDMHTDCAASDALAAKNARIDRALEQITPGANATVRRIARILKGEA